MMYGFGDSTIDQETRSRSLAVAELKMLRFSLGVTRKDKIKNEYIWICQVKEEEDQRRGSWMWQERTCGWLECQREI